jgi:starch phosphorylase
VTRATSPTPITLLPEALEKWTSTSCFRHLSRLRDQLRFLDEVRAAFSGDARLSRLSPLMNTRLATCAWPPRVSAATPSTKSRSSTELLKQTVLRDFAELWPGKFLA